MNLENMKKRRRVIETNPAWRKMINIQTEENHFFNMENRWKKVNAACFSVSPSQQNIIVVNLVASWSKVFTRESHPEQGAPGWPAVEAVTSSLCWRRVSVSERPGQPLINTGLLTSGSREAGHICKHTESVNCSCPQHIMLFPPHCWDNSTFTSSSCPQTAEICCPLCHTVKLVQSWSVRQTWCSLINIHQILSI